MRGRVFTTGRGGIRRVLGGLEELSHMSRKVVVSMLAAKVVSG